MHIRYLVTDYDDCAYSTTSLRPDNLSQPVIDMARTGDYDGFYGCTHRAYCSYQFLDKVTTAATRWIGAGFKSAANLNFPTYKVTENFSAATYLPNIAVSTLDDLLYHECGRGYTLVLKPYEVKKQLPAADTPYLRTLSIARELASKNYQLTLIAQHAAALHPEADIVLDYVDDKASLCNYAVTACAGEDWPKNVYLNTYNYRDNKIIPIYEPERFFDPAESLDEFFDASDVIPEAWQAWLENDEKETMARSALQANSIFGNSSKPSADKVLSIEPPKLA